jgi:hypothetical protein
MAGTYDTFLPDALEEEISEISEMSVRFLTH